MFKAFGNVVRIPELRRKFSITLGILCLCRVGVFIPIPGVNLAAMKQHAEAAGGAEGAMGRVMALADLFSGGALGKASILALGIMPYISAAIIFQMLVAVVPALSRIAREGESGRRRISQYTRYAAVFLCLIQSVLIMRMPMLRRFLPEMTLGFTLTAMLSMTAGSMFLMWMGEQIDEFGLGSGASLIIMINILSRVPAAVRAVQNRFVWTLGSGDPSALGPENVALLLALFVFMVVAVVLITQAQRRIPMNHARRTREGFSQRSYLPLRVNMAGVISIIFAQSVMILPSIFSRIPNYYVSKLFGYFLPWHFFYVGLYMGLIVFFSYFYTAIVFNPLEQANYFKQYGAFIPGIRPGRRTAEYLERIMSRITLAGAVFLAFIAVVPQIISSALRVEPNVASFFGGTGLLITVGVALDLIQRMESYMMMQAYEGFLKSGRIRGRRF